MQNRLTFKNFLYKCRPKFDSYLTNKNNKLYIHTRPYQQKYRQSETLSEMSLTYIKLLLLVNHSPQLGQIIASCLLEKQNFVN